MQHIHHIEQALSESSGLETNQLQNNPTASQPNLFTLSPEIKPSNSQILPRAFSSIRPTNIKIIPERTVDRLSSAEAIARQTSQTRNRLVKKDRKIKLDSSPNRPSAYDLRSSTVRISNLQEENEKEIVLENNYSYYKQAEFYKKEYGAEIDEQERKQKQEDQRRILEDNNRNKRVKTSQRSRIPVDSKSNLFADSDSIDYFPPSNSKSSFETGPIMTSQMSSRDELSSRNILNQQLANKQREKKLSTLKRKNDNDKYQPNIRFGKLVIPSSDIIDVANFISKPIPQGRVLQCTLQRNKSCSKMFFIDYDLVTASDEKLLLSTKKMPFRFNSTFNLSLQSNSYEETSEFYVGKAKGNFLGSIFNLEVESSSKLQREIVATIHYKSECFDFSLKAREIEIYLKSEDYRYDQLEGADRQAQPNLMYLYDIGKNKQLKKIKKLVNKKPKWNAVTEVFSLNFHGKSQMASVKNTIIIDEEKPDEYLLLLAKQGSNSFAMDISYPFSPIVALGLMISGFDFKLASQ